MEKILPVCDSEILQMPDQQKRLKTAKSSGTTPSSIDKTAQAGIFPGSGKVPYETTLEACTCRDYAVRKLPCKHMYRLAIELGMLEGSARTGVNKNELLGHEIKLEDAIAEIENLSDDAQKCIRNFIEGSRTDANTEFAVPAAECESDLLTCGLLEQIDSPVSKLRAFARNQIMAVLDENGVTGFKRNMSQEKLIAWGVENVPDIVSLFPEVYVFRVKENFATAKRSAVWYLDRKYDWDHYYAGDMTEMQYPHGAKLGEEMPLNGKHYDPEKYYLPEDKITKLLNFYGHNRCLNGFVPVPSGR